MSERAIFQTIGSLAQALDGVSNLIDNWAGELVSEWEGMDSGPRGERYSDHLFHTAKRVRDAAMILESLEDKE